MIELVKKFLWDETAFVRYSRAMLAGLGLALHNGVIPIEALQGSKAWWLGPALVTAAFMFGAGERNPKEGEK